MVFEGQVIERVRNAVVFFEANHIVKYKQNFFQTGVLPAQFGFRGKIPFRPIRRVHAWRHDSGAAFKMAAMFVVSGFSAKLWVILQTKSPFQGLFRLRRKLSISFSLRLWGKLIFFGGNCGCKRVYYSIAVCENLIDFSWIFVEK